jgi:SAM-dependent methyltransferase
MSDTFLVNSESVPLDDEFREECIVNIKAVTSTNRRAWNKVTPISRQLLSKNLRASFRQPNYSVLDNLATAKLRKIGLSGKYVAQLCCNIGQETISLVNLGADKAVGFDISDEAIKTAIDLNRVAGQDCHFVRSDVYDISAEYNGSFDLVYVSAGTLAWLPDLDRFFNVASRLLKNNGVLMVYEVHPVLYMFAAEEEESYDPNQPQKLSYSYFEDDAFVDDSGKIVVGDEEFESSLNYSYTQKLSNILNSTIGNCFVITEFSEYPHDISGTYKFLEGEQKLPMSFLLTARKMN